MCKEARLEKEHGHLVLLALLQTFHIIKNLLGSVVPEASADSHINPSFQCPSQPIHDLLHCFQDWLNLQALLVKP